jgi:hypothetical protein
MLKPNPLSYFQEAYLLKRIKDALTRADLEASQEKSEGKE